MAVRTSVVMLALLGAACFRAPVPMVKLDYAVNPPPKCLVVLLPGAGSNMGDFEKEGYLQKLQASGLNLDVIAANATLGYYFNNTMVTRLHDDIIAPAKEAKHYDKVWIMGMSMGGFGSLFYAQQRPDDVDGVYAQAPFLGDEKLGREIKEQGGLKSWKAPPKEESTSDNYQRQLWRWLQEVTTDPSQGPDLWMGWGKDDSLGPMDQLLADALPPGHYATTEGAHDWPPWNLLLERWLKDGPLATQCK